MPDYGDTPQITDNESWRKKLKLRSRCVRPITKDTFPVGVPVVIEAMCDSASGWEFDAPLHIMRPFHSYYIVSSIWNGTMEEIIEGMLIDLDTGLTIKPDDDAWPYTGDYLARVFRQVQRGNRRDRFWYFKSTVIVTAWGEADSDDDCVQYTVTTEES